MSGDVETLISQALNALQTDDMSTCLALTNQVLNSLPAGDERIPMALSIRGSARLASEPQAGINDMVESVRLAPNDWQIQRALGEAFLSLNHPKDAEIPLGKALQLSGSHPDVVASYAQSLIKQNKIPIALQILDRVIKAQKATPAVIKAFAQGLYQQGDIYSARDYLSMLYGDKGPETEEDQFQLARIDMSLREFEPAKIQLERILQNNPTSLRARLLAVTVANWTDDEQGLAEHVARLNELAPDKPDAVALVVEHGQDLSAKMLGRAEAMLEAPGSHGDGRISLAFALAKRYDQQKDYQRAWDMAVRANTLFAEHFNVVQTEARRAEQWQTIRRHVDHAVTLYRETANGAASVADERQKYIYLIGPPRSGSSLIQSILAAPEGVASIGERTSLYPYLKDACEHAVPVQQFREMAIQLGRAEAAGLQRMGVTAPLLIEKTPHHLFVAGLLDRVNPGARFVQVLRDAGEIGLSMFLRPFSVLFTEKSSLDALGDALELRLEVADKWRAAGLEILPFSFDRFRSNPKPEASGLFATLGLDWSPDYLDPKHRPEAVTTFSARQVRKPIYANREPVWKPYEAFAPQAFARFVEITEKQNALLAGEA